MAYRQFTQCTSINNYKGAVVAQAIIAAAIGAIPLIFGLIFGALALGPGVLAALMIPLLAIIAYCRWWLYDRLICLGGDVCAVGRLLGVEPPEDKSGLDAFDTDYSINLLLAPHAIGDTQQPIESDGIQGNLIKNQPDIVNAGLDFQGETSQVHSSDPKSAVLHCEFEGGGVYKLLIACLAALGYTAVALVAATIICAIPVIGWIACLIISLIFAAITAAIVGMGMANALDDKGNPNDVNANLGNLEQGKDLLVVKGTWVYDSAHEGWNEIHPIKHCQRIGTWADSWDAAFDGIKNLVPPNTTVDAKTYVKFWCDAIAAADSPQTHTNQAKPENHWEIHPEVDGCEPESDGGGDNVPK
jgi:multisubunit Na+/H+ antiporter MnhG subunit